MSLLTTGVSTSLLDRFERYRGDALQLIATARFPADIALALRQQLAKNIDATVDLMAKNPPMPAARVANVQIQLPRLTQPRATVFASEVTVAAPSKAPTPTPSPTPSPQPPPTPPTQQIVPNGIIPIPYGTVTLDAATNVIWSNGTTTTATGQLGEIFVAQGYVMGLYFGNAAYKRPADFSGDWNQFNVAEYRALRELAVFIVTAN